jgi:DNA-binding Xre family transcriptional regulator
MAVEDKPQPRPLTERVAEEIRVVMIRRGVNGKQLAGALGVSSAWVSYRLTGTQPIDLTDLERIAVALDVTVMDLIPRDLRNVVTVTQPNLAPYQANRGRPPGHPAGSSRPTGARRPQRSRPQLVPGYGLAG